MEVPGYYGMFGYNLIKRAFNLPEGTKYVAWRHHNSTDLSSLVVDYIKFDYKELIVTLPYYEDFEQVSMDDLIEKGWYIRDENEDGVSWELNYTNDTWGNAITSASYINGSAITPRERLRLPAIPLSRSISYFIGSDHKENFRETYSLSAYVRSYNSFDTVFLFSETIEEPGTATDLSGANLKFRQFNLPIGTISVTIYHGGSPGGSHLILDNVTLSGEYVNGLPDIGYDTSTAVKMYARDGVVYLDGLQKGDLVQAYALSGKLMYSSVASDSSAQFLLPKGIYVLRLGNYSSKLIVD